MFELIVLSIIFGITFHLFGKPVLLIAAMLSLIYIYWFSAPTRTPLSIEKFISSDKQLAKCISDFKVASENVPYEFNKIEKDIYNFIATYIICFNSDPKDLMDQFSNLTSLRRNILNDIAMLNLQQVEYDLDPMAKCTFKYISAIIQKFNIDYKYPIPANEFGNWDVY